MARLLEIFLALALTWLAVLFLYFGRDLLIPLVIAIVIWYLIISVAAAIRGVSLFGWHLPGPISLLGAIALCIAVLYSVFSLMTSNIWEIMTALPLYQERLTHITNNLLSLIGLEKMPDAANIMDHDTLIKFIKGLAQAITSIAGSMGIITLYVLFLLLEYNSFDAKLEQMIPDKKRLHTAQRVIKQISSQVQSYVRLKTLLSIITAACSYAVMFVVGVDFAIFWAQLIFLLNFIPTIGSIIATTLPCLLAILQFDSWYPFIFVTASLVSIQFTIGNVIEPRLIGNTVNLSGLVILLSLAIWGTLWGVTGMFVCVPIMVILNIIFANFAPTRPVAIMLSAKGVVPNVET